MRKNINNIVKIFSEEFPIQEPIVELGSFQVSGQEEIANLRPFFEGKEFIGCDMRKGTGVDRIEDIEKLSFQDSTIGTILLMDTLEHVQNCHSALNEVYRVLKKDGIVIMSSVMDFPIHDHPFDYWRFTPEAFKLLLGKFKIKIIGYEGNPRKPHTVFAIGIKSLSFDLKYKNHFDQFKKKYIQINNDLNRNLHKRNTIKIVRNNIRNIFKMKKYKDHIDVLYYNDTSN
ncbi:class I SAM-dependent methyltransferase [Candidatus Parcubacteria bacterium]|nr:class I SAM-dependent methyltransferase [Candidatus Parcubacteria bacterium]